jgi:hypothetical protein
MRRWEEFKVQAEGIGKTTWNISNCSMCGYETGFVFDEGSVTYDHGCHCVTTMNQRPSKWEEVALTYNMQTNPDVIKRMDEEWQFDVNLDKQLHP